MTNVEIFRKMYDEADELSLDDESGITCAPCEINKYDCSVFFDKVLVISLDKLQLQVPIENIEQGSFREDGTFNCTALVLFNIALKEAMEKGENPTEDPVKLEISFRRMQQFKPSDLEN